MTNFLNFSKYQACGNDFILIDDRENFFPTRSKSFIKYLCLRNYGIGADGLILLENSISADYKMRYFNCDGIEVEMCGNGIRCLGKFLKEIGIPGVNFNIEVNNRNFGLSLVEDKVKVLMGKPLEIKWGINIDLDNKNIALDFINTSVPQVVIFQDNINNTDVSALGSKIRHHNQFAPQGTNVNFVTRKENNNLEIRTFERGVELETLACGTGATAAAIAATKKFGLKGPVFVKTRSKEILEFDLFHQNGNLINVSMTGGASSVFQGKVLVETNKRMCEHI